ncbi:hypothetical protein F5B20DRAFT_567459 [Whalleya microplaca]|nr:hypothetical protein F5B20DRAFT_567459 [Whalleya microplaca]
MSALICFTSYVSIERAESSNNFGPRLDTARKNGPQIFNAVHNAMREFGSAFHHNGMSLFPAVVPEGVLLYHGTASREIPKSFEWVAFELEHAEAFARFILRSQRDDLLYITGVLHGDPPRRPPVGSPGEPTAGHLHIYQADRPLNVLYIDGMAAAKTDMGTDDSQDILLTQERQQDPWGDWQRAEKLCALAKEWGIDGLIRMEAGFEIIYCDFTKGLRRLSANQAPGLDDAGVLRDQMMVIGAWARAASLRYNGIGSSRVALDYSSMFSAFFYPVNLTNPDADRPELPRLLQATDEELNIMRQHVANSVKKSILRTQAATDWQGVTDMVVSRYVKHLPLLAKADSIDILRYEVNSLLNVHIDYAVADPGLLSARYRCSEFYLRSAKVETLEDRLIRAAIESTTSTICEALFEVRQLLVEDSDAGEQSILSAREIIKALMDGLAWYEWKECGSCEPHEFCFIAMWPWGDPEDHFNPTCRNISTIYARHDYWGLRFANFTHLYEGEATHQRKEDPETKEL